MQITDFAWLIVLFYVFGLFLLILLIFTCFSIIRMEKHINDLTELFYKKWEVEHGKNSVSSES